MTGVIAVEGSPRALGGTGPVGVVDSGSPISAADTTVIGGGIPARAVRWSDAEPVSAGGGSGERDLAWDLIRPDTEEVAANALGSVLAFLLGALASLTGGDGTDAETTAAGRLPSR